MRDHELLKEARSLQLVMVEDRRAFHRRPELGLEEHETAAGVAATLRELGLAVTEGVGQTGVVGLLKGTSNEPVVAVRADMDALPIQEETGLPFASEIPGRMHACGHDGHTAILLGLARLLSRHRDRLNGQVKFLFQPAEEGPGGAQLMIEDGALEAPPVEGVLGLHIMTDLPVGTVGVGYGRINAASDSFSLKIVGEGGHGGRPHQAVDAITAAAHVILALQLIASRETDPVKPVVLTVGTVNGGFRGNVIAPEVTLAGTVRTLHPEVRREVQERMRRLVAGTCQAHRATFELEFGYGYPSVLNDDRMVRLILDSAGAILGRENVAIIDAPSMGGEDFAYFAERVPSCFFRLGAGNPVGNRTFPGHHPRYDFDEDAMPVGVAVLAQAVMAYLVGAFS